MPRKCRVISAPAHRFECEFNSEMAPRTNDFGRKTGRLIVKLQATSAFVPTYDPFTVKKNRKRD